MESSHWTTDFGTAVKDPPKPKKAKKPAQEKAPRMHYLRLPRFFRPKSVKPAKPKRLHGKTVTLSIEDKIARVVVFKGNRVTGWGSANLQSSAPSDGKLDAKAARKTELAILLKELKANRCRVVTDLPAYSALVRHVHLQKVPKRYLEQVVLSEVMDTLPFTGDEVDVAWQLRRNGTGQNVFATAVAKTTFDELILQLKTARVHPQAAYPRATALAFASGARNALVAHLAPQQATVVLVRDGLPQVVHQVQMPEGESATATEQAESVAMALGQATGYHQTFESEESGALPLVLTGPLSETSLASAVQELVQREVLPFAPNLVYPAHFPLAEYAANVGLVFADQARVQHRRVVAKHRQFALNVLPERYLPRGFPTRAVAAFVGIALLGFLAVNLSGRVDVVSSNAAGLSVRADQLMSQERAQHLNALKLRAVQEKIQSVAKITPALESQLSGLGSDMDNLLARLETISREALPEGAHITSISLQGDTFAIAGTALSYEDIIRYTGNVRGSGRFSSVRVTQAQATSAQSESAAAETSFQIKATVPPSTTSDPVTKPVGK